MPSKIEDYAIIGDTKTVALVDLTGSVDWWCVLRGSFRRSLCRASRRGGQWTVVDRSERRGDQRHASLRAGDFDSRDNLRDVDGLGIGVRLHATVRRPLDDPPHRRGSQRHRRDAVRADRAVRVRSDHALGSDPATLMRLAKAWADQGWPAELDENGPGITAPFNAPSQGPPPWDVFRIKPHSVTVVLGTEPGGLTRFRF